MEGGASLFEMLQAARPWLRSAFVAPPPGIMLGNECLTLPACGDEAATDIAASLLEDGGIDALAVRLTGAAAAAEQHGAALHSKQYVSAVAAMDNALAKLLAAVRRRREEHPQESWIVLFTSVGTAADSANALVLAGLGTAEVPTGEISPPASAVDVAMTALQHFSVIPQPAWALQGRSLLSEDPLDLLHHPSKPSAVQPAALLRAPSFGAQLGCRWSERFVRNLPGVGSDVAAVVGHRGNGMNGHVNKGPGFSVRENTLASFRKAYAAGVRWVELDVQITKDGVPVVWHDDYVVLSCPKYVGPRGVGVVRNELSDLSLSEFRAAGPLWERRSAAPTTGACGLMRAVGLPGAKKDVAWDCAHEDRLPTLEEVLLELPEDLGLNLELKYMDYNVPDASVIEMGLRTITKVVETHGANRRVYYSSFEPTAAVMMHRIQHRTHSERPVFFLTDAALGDNGPHPDHRRNSVRAAIEVASAAGLAGIVTDVAALEAEPALVSEVRTAGLLLATYGKRNVDLDLYERQRSWGVCAVITDNVAELVTASGSLPGKIAEPAKESSPVFAAAASSSASTSTLLPAPVPQMQPLSKVPVTATLSSVHAI